jgi:hypothetical protein
MVCGVAAWVLGLTACKQDAQVRGAVAQVGRGVPGAAVRMECPDGPRRETTTSAGGEFRFDDLGPGVDDRCELEVQVQTTGRWVAPQSVASRCGQHDRTGRCTQASFSFEVP